MSSEEQKEEPPAAVAAEEVTEKKEEKEEEKEEKVVKEDLPLIDISEPRESDVLCGRGGAALRHPGNQTYRRLVNLNKGLYITCLKTEKLKISRSIVAAIREQNGRFLERNSKKGTWFDIGDKKAIEKTSQALREGQPKLRQKMIESGQIPPDQQPRMEHQFGNGVYNPRGGSQGGSGISSGLGSAMGSGVGSGIGSGVGSGMYSDAGSVGAMAQNSMLYQSGMDSMPPPPARQSSDMNPDALMQRLSLGTINPQSIPSWTPSMASMDERSLRSCMRPSLQLRGSGMTHDMGMGGLPSNLSAMSDFSAYSLTMQEAARFGAGGDVDGAAGGGQMDQMGQNQPSRFAFSDSNNNNNNHGGSMPPPPPPPPPPDISPMMASPSIRSGYDRRRLLAKMKYRPTNSRAGQSSQRSVGDGMPDIHMVDSQFSLMSNLSGHGSRHHDPTTGLTNLSDHGMKDSEMFGVGSRRSLMSGLSKISDTSDLQSVFSDMSRKIGGSTRSMAMSEISGVDEEGLDLQTTFDVDTIPSAAKSSEQARA